MAVIPLTLPTVIPNLIRANWAGVVQIEPASQTDISTSRETGAEDRRQLVDRPARTVTVTLTGMSQEESTELWMNLVRMAGERTVLPLYPDQGVTDATSSGQFINVDTTLKRFYVGARVVIFDLGDDGLPDQIEYRTIVAVTATQIDLGAVPADQLQNTYAAGAYVFPLLDIEIDLESSKGISQTDYHFEVAFQATEVVGQSALPWLTDGLPSGFPTYLGYPILTIGPHWGATLSSSARSLGDGYELGVGFVAEPRGDRPVFDHELTLRALDRESGWDALTFVESRAGRLRPWWLVNPNSLFSAVAIATTHVDVEPFGNIEDLQDFLPYVVIEAGGNPIIRGVASVALSGGNYRITFDTTITAPALADIVRTTSADLVRHSSDEHREVWTTDTIVEVTVKAESLIDEADYPIAGIDVPAPTLGPLAEMAGLYCWFSASGPCWTDLDGGGLNPTDPTEAYPQALQQEDDTDFVYDVRQHPTDITLNEPYLQRWDTGDGATAPQLAYFKDVRYNNGMRTFYHFGIDQLIGWTFENSQAPFWDATDGLTIVIVARFGGPAFAGSFVEHFHFFREGIFEWFGNGTVGEVRMFATADVVVGAANFTYTEPTDSTLRILAFRWDPGVVAELFIGGGTAVGSAATPAASLDPDPRDTDALQYRGNVFGGGSGAQQQIDFNLDRQCMSDELYIVQRALTDTELNTVANLFAAKYDLLWDNVT